MPSGPPDSRELGTLFTISQVGMEMVAPVVVGLVLETYFPWRPWGVVGGAVLGLIVGIMHLVVISNRANRRDPPDKPRQEPT